MPQIQAINAICYLDRPDRDLSKFIAPPYDVIDKDIKRELLMANTRNIVAIDLPHLSPKTAGPDEVYQQAGDTFRRWLDYGILVRRDKPAFFVYQQTYSSPGNPPEASNLGQEPGLPGSDGTSGGPGRGRTYQRRGVFANVRIQPFGRSSDGGGGIHPHEKTYSGPKEDRMKLMRATRAQLSPIFGLYSDPQASVGRLMADVIGSGTPNVKAVSRHDQVLHELWTVEDASGIRTFTEALSGFDIFIADGHHRYTTALNYRDSLIQTHGPLPDGHPANFCLFVLVAMQDPGMLVLPTHRVLGGMTNWSMDRFTQASAGKLKISPFPGNDLTALEATLPTVGPHAIGLYNPASLDKPLAIATTVDRDPLAGSYPGQSEAWRQLDVAIVQHLIVEDICQSHFCCSGEQVAWKFPHTLSQLREDASGSGYQLGLVLQPTSLESVRLVSEAGELMPQKSTFFYPKLATGLVIHPLE